MLNLTPQEIYLIYYMPPQWGSYWQYTSCDQIVLFIRWKDCSGLRIQLYMEKKIEFKAMKYIKDTNILRYDIQICINGGFLIF